MMSIEVDPKIERIIREQVERGAFPDAAAVVTEAVRRLEAQEKLERLRTAIAMTDEDVANGDLIDLTPEYIERFKRRVAPESVSTPIPDDIQP